MTAAKKLLDKAALHCSPANYVGLSVRTGLTTSVLSGWKLGRYPMPQERIAEIARIARVDAGEWIVLIEADQTNGETRKAYGTLVKRLGIAALLGIICVPGMASDFAITRGLSIMSTLVKYFRGLGTILGGDSTPHENSMLLLQA